MNTAGGQAVVSHAMARLCRACLLLLLVLGPLDRAWAESFFYLDNTVTNSSEWRKMAQHFRERPALRRAQAQQSLIRVRLERGDRKETIQALAAMHTVLDPPGPPRCGRGRGSHMNLEDGEFFMVDHLPLEVASAGTDTLFVATMSRRAEVPLARPPPGTLLAVGDLVLKEVPATHRGSLRVVMAGKKKLPVGRYSLTIGPLVAGGSYGETYRFKSGGVCEFRDLPAGTYVIVVPDVDPVKDRWKVAVEAGQCTEVNLVVDDAGDIELGAKTVKPMGASP